jgi:phosphodiesterase/alkaline phosphatase D-like protein
MAHIAEMNRPDFFLNLGDNIYWNGVENVEDERFEVRTQF